MAVKHNLNVVFDINLIDLSNDKNAEYIISILELI